MAAPDLLLMRRADRQALPPTPPDGAFIDDQAAQVRDPAPRPSPAAILGLPLPEPARAGRLTSIVPLYPRGRRQRRLAAATRSSPNVLTHHALTNTDATCGPFPCLQIWLFNTSVMVTATSEDEASRPVVPTRAAKVLFAHLSGDSLTRSVPADAAPCRCSGRSS